MVNGPLFRHIDKTIDLTELARLYSSFVLQEKKPVELVPRKEKEASMNIASICHYCAKEHISCIASITLPLD